MDMLRDLRKVAKKLGVPPFVVFQEPSLRIWPWHPVSQVELINIME
jgi:ATP-dependent DNA helicase RecQ